jgi:signal transduction histidine kinase
MKLSLRSRLVLSFVVIIVVTTGLVAVLTNRIAAERFTYYISNMGQMQAYQLEPLFSEYYARVGSWDGVESLMAQVLENPLPYPGMGGTEGGMMGMMGMAGCSEDTWMAAHMASGPGLCDDVLLLADPSGQVVASSEAQSLGFDLSAQELAQGAEIVVGERHVGTLVVASALGALTPDQREFLEEVNRLMAGAAVLAGLAVLLVGSWQARRILAPVRALAEAARRVAAGEFAQVPVDGQDELGEMARAFNTMAAELERQQDLRRRAMADIAHELRTPLSVLQIDLESIEDGLTEPTPEVIGQLQEEVALLNRLVDDLRVLSLAEAGELGLELHSLDVGELATSAVERVRGAAVEKELELVTEVSEGLPLVQGDRQRLSQVLLNLFSNAVRHTPRGGRIVVSARQVGQELHVAVQDEGEGIPSDELERVFGRFYRTDQARSRDTGGTGLGLAIARGLVEAHGGRIWAESAEGHGSTFAFALPLGMALD